MAKGQGGSDGDVLGRLGGRMLRWFLFGIGCLLLFALSSAYVSSRGWSNWVALTVGLLVFPSAPLIWQAVGARRRRKAGKSNEGAGLSRLDRFTLRLAGVGLLVFGPLVAIDGAGLWNAARFDTMWWLDRGGWVADPVPVRDARMLDVVPGDAEAILWESGHGQLRGMEGGGDEEAILAYAEGKVVVAVHDTPEQLDALRYEDLELILKMSGLPLAGHLAERRVAPDLLVLISDGWVEAVDARLDGGGSRPDDLIEGLRSPPGTSFAAVWRPSAWAEVDELRGHMREGADGSQTVRVEIDAPDDDAAEKARRRLELMRGPGRTGLGGLGGGGGASCREPYETALEGATLERHGAQVVAEATIPAGAIESLSECF